ncbi:hypothetical protein [Mycolicibacterium sp. YH-1]|uniref:hypothetical protein n=1 Tax=Mycolicibacterium sp. YH-1 TaxID=2908837 RepID=UPI001F4C4809|nr:hypothetical protein [Mycolicibacterium sp. YH-1]UNB54555.1 hypothetical protein L0M16_09655 [Mycolicibacterium sp. YH-1]
MVLIKIPTGESGQLEDRWAVVPKVDIEIADTWRVAGMRGTGSHDAILSDAFIPAHRMGGSEGVFFEPAVESRDENPLSILSMQVVFAVVFAPVALGSAEAAVALHTEQLQKRKAAISGVPLAESHSRRCG